MTAVMYSMAPVRFWRQSKVSCPSFQEPEATRRRPPVAWRRTDFRPLRRGDATGYILARPRSTADRLVEPQGSSPEGRSWSGSPVTGEASLPGCPLHDLPRQADAKRPDGHRGDRPPPVAPPQPGTGGEHPPFLLPPLSSVRVELGSSSTMPLVLLHGLEGSRDVWKPIMPRLAVRHRLLAPDLPGFGRASPLPDGVSYSVARLATLVEGGLHAAGIQTAHVAGLSTGGLVALELGRRGRALSVVALSPWGLQRGWERLYGIAMLRAARVGSRLAAPWAEELTRGRLAGGCCSQRAWPALRECRRPRPRRPCAAWPRPAALIQRDVALSCWKSRPVDRRAPAVEGV